jgi:hypothetical protein
MRPLAALLCLLITTACLENGPAAPSPVDVRVTLAPGQDVSVASGVSLRFVGVAGDSRCPADAFCVLGGDAEVKIAVAARGATAERSLHTGNMQPVTVEDVRIELVQLQPYPFSAQPIEPAAYRATFRITR